MERKRFTENFKKAIHRSIEFGQKFITEVLPSNYVLFLIEIDSLGKHDSKNVGTYGSVDGAIDLLYKDGAIPRWINLNIKTIKNNTTVIRCEYSNIFIEKESNLLHIEEQLPPFHVLGPHIPYGHGTIEGGKFKIKQGKFSIKNIPDND